VEAKAYASEIAQLRITAEENVRALSSIAAVTATEIGVLRDDTTVRFFVATGSTNTALATFIHTVKGPKPVGIHALPKVLDGQSGVLITLIFGPDSPQKGQSFTVALAQSGMTNTNSIIRPH